MPLYSPCFFSACHVDVNLRGPVCLWRAQATNTGRSLRPGGSPCQPYLASVFKVCAGQALVSFLSLFSSSFCPSFLPLSAVWLST